MAKVQPFISKYKHDDTLVEGIPDYLRSSTEVWLKEELRNSGFVTQDPGDFAHVGAELVHTIELHLRERSTGRRLSDFVGWVFSDDERALEVLNFCLQKISCSSSAQKLDGIFSIAGSAYSVTVPKGVPSYQRGGAELTRRVSEAVKNQADTAIASEQLLADAWVACYGKKPDPEKVVSRCVDVLEGLLKKKYFPNDPKPALGKFVNAFIQKQATLSFAGDSLVSPTSALAELAKEFVNIRGQHTNGTGRAPTFLEAKFVLHYTIMVWHLHQ